MEPTPSDLDLQRASLSGLALDDVHGQPSWEVEVHRRTVSNV